MSQSKHEFQAIFRRGRGGEYADWVEITSTPNDLLEGDIVRLVNGDGSVTNLRVDYVDGMDIGLTEYLAAAQ